MTVKPIPVSGEFVTRQIREMWNSKDLSGLCMSFPESTLAEIKAIGQYKAHVRGDQVNGYEFVTGRES